MRKTIKIIEVGPRDGLQNEAILLNISSRLELVQKLALAGVKHIELGAFVSSDWVPQMAGSEILIRRVRKLQIQKIISPTLVIRALVPNVKGMQAALRSGVHEVAIFTAASESFVQKNINCSIGESLNRFEPVLELARKHRIKVRGYLSTSFGCPYEGEIPINRVVQIAQKLLSLGVYEISIGDTIGVAHPRIVRSLLAQLTKKIPIKKLAMHFHDTRGMALANILASLQCGVEVFDTSIGGLGGCPYAPGASGNVATEDAVYLLHCMGKKTGIDLNQLVSINGWLAGKVQHSLPSKYSQASALVI